MGNTIHLGIAKKGMSLVVVYNEIMKRYVKKNNPRACARQCSGPIRRAPRVNKITRQQLLRFPSFQNTYILYVSCLINKMNVSSVTTQTRPGKQRRSIRREGSGVKSSVPAPTLSLFALRQLPREGQTRAPVLLSSAAP